MLQRPFARPLTPPPAGFELVRHTWCPRCDRAAGDPLGRPRDRYRGPLVPRVKPAPPEVEIGPACQEGIFGSFATGEQKEGSDVDVLVELDRPAGLFKFVGLKFFLEDKLKMKVDLATKGALKPLIKDEILSETIYL